MLAWSSATRRLVVTGPSGHARATTRDMRSVCETVHRGSLQLPNTSDAAKAPARHSSLTKAFHPLAGRPPSLWCSRSWARSSGRRRHENPLHLPAAQRGVNGRQALWAHPEPGVRAASPLKPVRGRAPDRVGGSRPGALQLGWLGPRGATTTGTRKAGDALRPPHTGRERTNGTLTQSVFNGNPALA